MPQKSSLSKEAPGQNNTLMAGAINRYLLLGEATHGMRDYQAGSIRALARQLTQPMYSPLDFNRPPENPDHELTKRVDGGSSACRPAWVKPTSSDR